MIPYWRIIWVPFFICNNWLYFPFYRLCILCIAPWRRSRSPLVYPLPLSPLLRGRRLGLGFQVLFPCYLLCLALELVQLLSKKLYAALLLWSTLLPSAVLLSLAPVLPTYLQNSPLSPVRRYVASHCLVDNIISRRCAKASFWPLSHVIKPNI